MSSDLIQDERDLAKLKQHPSGALSETAIVLLEKIDDLKILIAATSQKADGAVAQLNDHDADQLASLSALNETIDNLRNAVSLASQQHQANRALIFQHHVASGRVTTVGGNATEVFAVPGVKAADLVQIQIEEVGVSPVSLICSKCLLDSISVTFSADPADDHILNFFVGE